jgi:SMODS and SLOG-associating 2TM effector domain 1
VSEHSSELLGYYRKYRVDDQLDFYAGRKDLFDRATGQGLAISATLLGLASAVSALAGTTAGWTGVWSAASAILPAISTALAAYLALYAFDQQSKLYGDAVRAVYAAARRAPNPGSPETGHSPEEGIADFVKKVEGTFRLEHAQWGQLTSQIQIPDQTQG